jgi:hypothetical protein
MKFNKRVRVHARDEARDSSRMEKYLDFKVAEEKRTPRDMLKNVIPRACASSILRIDDLFC